MENNKQSKGFKIAVFAILVIFATLFYIEYVKSNRYIVIPTSAGASDLYDTKKDVYIYVWDGKIHEIKRYEGD